MAAKHWIGLAAITAILAVAFPAIAETPLERGAYLVRGPAHCGACHTNAAPGSPELGGGRRFAELAFTAIAANLTPDETGVAAWSDAELVNGLRNGKRPRGSLIGPPMPIGAYRGISDADARAIVAYLRRLKPAANKTARSSYRVPLPDSYGPIVTSVPAIDAGDPLAQGRYLAHSVAACMDCHSRPDGRGAPDMANGLGVGGMEIRGPEGVMIAPNITPSGIGFYTDEQLTRVITTGERPDGSKLKGAMPVAYYANMSAGDAAAIVAYLRTLPKK